VHGVALPWRRPKYELLLLVLVAIAALSPVYHQNAQDPSRICLAAALPHGSLSNDTCLNDAFDRAKYGGHLYSDKAPGLSLLQVPSVELLRPSSAPERWPSFFLRLWGIRVLSSGLLFVLAAFLVGRLAEGLAPRYGAASLVAFALGTLVAPLAATSFSHVATGSLLLAAFVLAWARRPAAAGLVAGLAALTDYPAVLATGIIGGYVAVRGGRAAVRYALGLAPGVALLALYDWAAFGAPWHTSYRYVDNIYAGMQGSGFFGIAWPHSLATFEVFAGPSGLLVASPVLVLAAFGLVLLGRSHRAEAVTAAAVAGLYVLLNCGYFLPYGGVSPGPRFLVPAIPFLALGFGPAFARLPRTAAVATVFSVASMLAIELVWSANKPMRGTVWGELARVPAQLGSSRYAGSLTETILHEAGAGAAVGTLAVAVPAVASIVLALTAMPWREIRHERAQRPRPLRAVAAGMGAVYLVAAADVAAASGYPYGNRTAGRAIQLALLDTQLTPAAAHAKRGGHVDFAVSVISHETTTAKRLLLTIKLTPGLRLDGAPAYSIGKGCSGTSVVVCDLDYLPSYGKTHVYFGVTVTQQANQAVSASLTSAGIPGYDHPKATVQVSGSTIFLAGD